MQDWAGLWLDQLAEAGLPGMDFVMLKADNSFQKFVGKVATCTDCQASLHVLLMMPPLSFTAQQAATFNPHGWRHVFTTACKQLGIIDEDINLGAH